MSNIMWRINNVEMMIELACKQYDLVLIQQGLHFGAKEHVSYEAQAERIFNASRRCMEVYGSTVVNLGMYGCVGVCWLYYMF